MEAVGGCRQAGYLHESRGVDLVFFFSAYYSKQSFLCRQRQRQHSRPELGRNYGLLVGT